MDPLKLQRHSSRVVSTVATIWAVLSVAIQLNAGERAVSPELRKTLKRVEEACQLYKIQNGRFPGNLTDLVGFLSPNIRASIPGKLHLKDPSSDALLAMRRSPVGDRVPWLQLESRDAPFLDASWINVSCDGTVFRSGVYWQTEFVEMMPMPYLLRPAFMSDPRAIHERVPPRAEPCSTAQLNLAPHATALPANPWFVRPEWKPEGFPKKYPEGEYLPALSSITSNHVLTVSNHLFDVRALVHLDGATGRDAGWYRGFPIARSNIVVEASASKLHVLAGAFQKSDPGTRIASIRLNYAEGGPAEIPILYGVHVTDAWEPAPKGAVRLFPDPSVLNGTNNAGKAVPSLQFFTVENPRPNSVIKNLDLLSAQAPSHPYFLAITVEK